MIFFGSSIGVGNDPSAIQEFYYVAYLNPKHSQIFKFDTYLLKEKWKAFPQKEQKYISNKHSVCIADAKYVLN